MRSEDMDELQFFSLRSDSATVWSARPADDDCHTTAVREKQRKSPTRPCGCCY